MRRFIFLYPILLGPILFSIGCSSLKRSAVRIVLKRSKDKKAGQIKFWSPSLPYKRQNHAQLDALWWNPNTKNSISYFSNCSKTHSQSLKEIERGTLSEIGRYQLMKREYKKDSIYSIVKILHSDGQKTMSGIYTFKKASCFYILNFVSSSKNSFNKDLPIFKKFIKGFKVQ